MDQVRVLIVDDQETFLRAMRAVVRATDGFVLVGEARSAEESLEAAETLVPDLVLMDVHLPGMDGIEATRLLTASSRGPVVLLLSTYPADQLMRLRAARRRTESHLRTDLLLAAWAAVDF